MKKNQSYTNPLNEKKLTKKQVLDIKEREYFLKRNLNGVFGSKY